MFIATTIYKKVLFNGLVVLVNPIAHLPKVSIGLQYHVGAKDEKLSEKGMAHLIEHMLFKGTNKLSESDLSVIAYKLSGSTNAWTWYDYTAYTFQLYSWNYQEAFSLLADTMVNARFDEQMLNSELKAVIQELKMRKDNYGGILFEDMVTAIFHDHPYHYPVIGFKQDLWNLNRNILYNFYKKHYLPNNAVLTVVGDVDPEEVFKEVEKQFGGLQPNMDYKKEEFYHGQDLVAKSVTLYRPVKNPRFSLVTTMPGGKKGNEYLYDFVAMVLANGKQSRLTKRLVDDLKLVSYIYASTHYIEDAAIFAISCEPYDMNNLEKIKAIIHEEIAHIIKEGITQEEIESVSRQVKLALATTLENYSTRVKEITRGYMMMNDEYYIFKFADYPLNNINQEIKECLSTYFAPNFMHQGLILPIDPQDEKRAKELQELSDIEDARILNGRERHSAVEEAKAAKDLVVPEPTHFDFPKPTKQMLSNGVKLFYHETSTSPTISGVITFKARSDYDSVELPGLYIFMAEMLLEGSKNYKGTTLAQEFEKYGIEIALNDGVWHFTCLKSDLDKALELIHELLTNVTFEDDAAIEKVRAQRINSLKRAWDEPSYFYALLVKQEIYKNHPYGKITQGTFESLQAISKQDLKDFYKKVVTHDGMRVSIVGDIASYDIQKIVEKYIGVFKGQPLEEISYPPIPQFVPKNMTYYINRDQVVLAYFAPSIKRLDPKYDMYCIFDQLFSGSMNSRLYTLREKTGIFYSIGETLTASSDIEPGFFLIQTMVTKDRLQEAKEMISKTINEAAATLTEEEIKDAKKAVINSKINNFAKNISIASTFLMLDRFGLPDDYYDTYAQYINTITLADVQNSVKDVLKTEHISLLEVGRV